MGESLIDVRMEATERRKNDLEQAKQLGIATTCAGEQVWFHCAKCSAFTCTMKEYHVHFKHKHDPEYLRCVKQAKMERKQEIKNKRKERAAMTRRKFKLCSICWLLCDDLEALQRHENAPDHLAKLNYVEGSGCDLCRITFPNEGWRNCHPTTRRHQKTLLRSEQLPRLIIQTPTKSARKTIHY